MNKDSKIPLALWISMIGIALFMVFSFMGDFLKTGDYALNIIYAVGKTLAIVLLLWLMTYAKRAENHIEKWKIVEMSTLAVFIVVSVLFSMPLLRFFSVNLEKSQIQDCAQQDVENIKSIINAFENSEKECINNTYIGLSNYYSSSIPCTEAVEKYINQVNIQRKIDVDTWLEYNLEELDITLCQPLYDSLENCSNAITNWKLFELPFSADGLTRLAQQVPISLQQFASDNYYPSINVEKGKYDITDNSRVKVGKILELQFPTQLTKRPNITILNVFMVILINLLILFRYIMAFRSRKVSIANNVRGGQYGGQPIA